MYLTLGVTILDSTTEMHLVLSFQFTVGAPVWRSRDSIYLLISLAFMTALYMHLIYPSLESEAIYG